MKEPATGAHLKTYRLGYSHHGIYCGNGEVIHYSGFANGLKKGALEVTTLEGFVGSASKYYIVSYPDHVFRYTKKEIVKRAKSRIGEDDYSLLLNNCEHFAVWCITGKKESKQVKSVLSSVTLIAVRQAAVSGLGSAVGVSSAAMGTKVLGGAALGTTGIAAVGTTTSGSAVSGAAIGGTVGAVSSAFAIGSTAGAVSGAAVGGTALGTAGFVAAGAATAISAPAVLPAVAIIGTVTIAGSLLGSLFD